MLFRGLGAALGGFGRSIIKRLQEIGQSVASALRLAGVAGVEVEPAAVAHEWGQVRATGERAEMFAVLRPDEVVPEAWYEVTSIPWKRPFGYRIAIYGRDLATGQFASIERNFSYSREYTTGEILDDVRTRMGVEGDSPIFDVWSAKVVAAFSRPEL